MLVIQVCGLITPYKFTIALELTAATCDPNSLKELIDSCISGLYQAGIRVRAITSDMGPLNKGIWNLIGIKANRRINPHPSALLKLLLAEHCYKKFCYEFQKLEEPIYFFADPTHLFKLIRNELITHDLHLPAWVKNAYHIDKGKCIVSWRWIQRLYNIQQSCYYRLAYKITPNHLHPSSFEKMRVNLVFHIFSEQTSAAFKTCIAKKLIPEDATAPAILCKQVSRWFKLINNRLPILALHKDHETENKKHLICYFNL